MDAALSYQMRIQYEGAIAMDGKTIYSSSRNTRDFNHEIRAQSEIRLHREYNLAMKNKSLRRMADVRSGRR